MTENTKQKISIKLVIIISFIIIFLSTFFITGFIVFSSWMSSAEETILKYEEDLSDEIYREINAYVSMPFHIIEVNEKNIANQIVDLNNQKEREQFFAGVLKAHFFKSLYSFSFGTANGEYYGARRNIENEIEIMKNNESTGGNSWYYKTNEDLTSGELAVQAGQFDPRVRPWYTIAKEKNGPAFAPVYRHFYMNDLTLSASRPVYFENDTLAGVLGAHVTLGRINEFLEEITLNREANAVIVDKNSGDLIANSYGENNFIEDSNGIFTRKNIAEIGNPYIKKLYTEYQTTGLKNTKTSENGSDHHINLSEYNREELDWLIITDISESPFIQGIINYIYWSFIISILAVILAVLLYFKLVTIYFKPIENLINTTEKYSKGDFEARAEIIRNDETGKLAIAFNNMADRLKNLIGNLESLVAERTAKLKDTNESLIENKEQLQLILDSTVEAIYGIDINGNCIFCNASCLKLLGYDSQEELLGKNMHYQIHHSWIDGTEMDIYECKIINGLKYKEGVHVEDEVFWKYDGSFIEVEYNSYPQLKNGEIIGAVVTFIDNSEKKKNQEHIKFLSYHDSLTGLYNRMFFEEEMKRLDVSRNIPIAIIFADVNGLKLTNDIFGHVMGDKLLKKSAEILKKVCRGEDIIARVGGDEFAILLPETTKEETEEIIKRIKEQLSNEKIAAIKCSMALGYSIKKEEKESTEIIMKYAEDNMYKEKTMARKNTNTELLNTIIETLHERSLREKEHSLEVGTLCKKIAEELEMEENEVRKVKDAGFIHDLGKIIFNKNLLNKEEEDFDEEEQKEFQQHSTIGYRILNLFDETLDLAEGVLNHHENWDGTGFPKGLKGKEIPLTARIIAVAESYDAMTSEFSASRKTKEEAIKELESLKGIRYESKIVEALKKVL